MRDQGNSNGSPTAEKVTPASEDAAPVEYFVRTEFIGSSVSRFHIVMRDEDGFESVIDSARSQEVADRKANSWRVKEAKANAANSARK